MFEELDATELALGRRGLRAIGWRVGMVTVSGGSLPYSAQGWESPERALVAALDPDGESGVRRHEPSKS